MSEEILDEIREWLKLHRERICPKCTEQKFKPSLVKGTFWCPNCDKYWQVEKSKITGVYNWRYKEIVERAKDE